MNTYFKIKLFTNYILPAIIIGLVILISIIYIIKSSIRESRIKKFFKENGYQRKLFGVASCGKRDFYGWVRKSDNKIVDEREIQRLSLKQIRNKYR